MKAIVINKENKSLSYTDVPNPIIKTGEVLIEVYAVALNRADLFQREIENIYRLKVPFETIYTSVFLVKTEGGNVLVDCATFASDVDEYILPALNQLGLHLTDIACLILTHYHSDHAGGKARILELVPNMKIVQNEGGNLLSDISVYALKGHTLDCIGVFDKKSKTLITGDGLQGAGIGKYRCSLESKDEYLKTIEKIGNNESIENILFSHEYEPWYKDGAFGREEVKKCLDDCKKYIM